MLPNHKRPALVILLGVSMLATACGTITSVPFTSPVTTAAVSTPEDAAPLPAAGTSEASSRETSPLPLPGEIVPTIPPAEPSVTGEASEELLGAILADLEKRLGVTRESIAVVETEAVTWNDGSLGCPQPGMMYTQALVDGYRVALQHGDQTFDYHASDRGYFFLCEQGLPLKPVKPLPPSGSTGLAPGQ